MSSALLSRFDLIFILLDSPNSMRDEMISEHVIKLHSSTRGMNASTPTNSTYIHTRRAIVVNLNFSFFFLHCSCHDSGTDGSVYSMSASGQGRDRPAGLHEEQSMRDRLSAIVQQQQGQAPIPPSLLRTYVEYAKQYCTPTYVDGDCGHVSYDIGTKR